MSEPPAYDKSAYGQGFNTAGQGYNAPGQGYNAPGQGQNHPGQGFTAPGQGFTAPPAYGSPGQGFGAPPVNQVMYVASPSFGAEHVTTICRNCQANITTSTSSETGTVAWISAGVLCLMGCVCCFWIPLTMGSLKDVTHKCPSCNSVVGRYKAKM
eukprot:GFUD01033759.1.p1 GENE.GFUD01033759.1~~GFUD01033759.1.p1  ORF type:complete len:165 (-),score=44.42 GFUD01033759.1:138-602(-)